MKTYIFPVAYIIEDDSVVNLELIKVQANNPEEGVEAVKEVLIEREKKDDEDGDGIPAIWLQGVTGDEEGYQIGDDAFMEI